MKIRQGDIIWINFSPSVGTEMKGRHPAVVVSSNAYNEKTSYVIVCPITSHGNEFAGYIPLRGYKVHGRINAIQVHSFSLKRTKTLGIIDKLRTEDLIQVKQVIDYALEVD